MISKEVCRSLLICYDMFVSTFTLTLLDMCKALDFKISLECLFGFGACSLHFMELSTESCIRFVARQGKNPVSHAEAGCEKSLAEASGIARVIGSL